MARPKKTGFDSFELTNDFFADEFVRSLSDEFGVDGVIILLSVLTRLSKHYGYYLPTSSIYIDLIQADTNMVYTVEYIQSVVDKSVELGIFDSGLYSRFGILTSESLQSIFVSRSRLLKRRNIEFNEDYRLIPIPEEVPKKAKKPKVDFPELGRRIIEQWNMLNESPDRSSFLVSSETSTDPVFLEGLQNIVDKYADTGEMLIWFDITRNAFVSHRNLRLGHIICHEPTFRMLYDMGEPLEFIPGEYSPPMNLIHPALKQEARMKKSGYSQEEIDRVTEKLLHQQPTSFPKPVKPENDGFTDYPVRVSVNTEPPKSVPVYITNESTVPIFARTEEIEAALDPDLPDDDEIREQKKIKEALKRKENRHAEKVEEYFYEEYEEEDAEYDAPSFVPEPSDETDKEEPVQSNIKGFFRKPETDNKTPRRVPGKVFANRNDVIMMDGKELIHPKTLAKNKKIEEEKKFIQKVSEQLASHDDLGVHEYDPELSPLLAQIMTNFKTAYEGKRMPFVKFRVDETWSENSKALEYLRAFIETDERAKTIEFWDEIIDTSLWVGSRLQEQLYLDPDNLFYPKPHPVLNYPMEERLKTFLMFVKYAFTPEKANSYVRRELMNRRELRQLEKEIHERDEEQAKQEQQKKEEKQENNEEDDKLTEIQRKTIEAIRNNPNIPKADMEWLEERVRHPERFKAPDKPYGDRTHPLPWAKKKPMSAEEVMNHPSYCKELPYGSKIHRTP